MYIQLLSHAYENFALATLVKYYDVTNVDLKYYIEVF